MSFRVWLLVLTGLALTFVASPQEPAVARWWKGNLHTHTFWSDGDEFPEMVASWYRDHGYHFLTLSDHNIQSRGEKWMEIASLNKRAGVDALAAYQARFGRWVEARGGQVRLKNFDETRSRVDERDRFLLMPSEEITGKSADGREIHMNATNLLDELPMAVAPTLPDTILANLRAVAGSARRTARPVLFNVNHPNYKWGVDAEALAAVPELEFFEVWNGVDNDNDPGDATHPSTDDIWDRANALRLARGGRPLYGLAVDDAHDHQPNKTRARPGRAWIQVRAPYLTAPHLIAAMRAGDFYASSGVTLRSVQFRDRRLSLDIAAAPGEAFSTRFTGVRRGGEAGETFAEVTGNTPSYTLRDGDLYVRAIVASSLAPEVPSQEFPYRRAWTQPVGWRAATNP